MGNVFDDIHIVKIGLTLFGYRLNILQRMLAIPDKSVGHRIFWTSM